ncbi:hypothetical protein HMPREF0297_1575 [Corynebacterium jeikeium ATCC 43734]|nr:hypothetical protein HMPREF0297_1575 [Corynebacterium jeikeium ATCC 43734]
MPELDWLAAVQAPHSNWVRDLLNGRVDGDAVSQTIGLDAVGVEVQVRGDTRVGNSCSAHHLDVMAISLVQSHEQALLATRRKVVAHTPVAPDETGQQKQSLPAEFAPMSGICASIRIRQLFFAQFTIWSHRRVNRDQSKGG